MSEPQKMTTDTTSDTENMMPTDVPEKASASFRERLNKLAERYQDDPRIKKIVAVPLVKQFAQTAWANKRPVEALLAGLLVFFVIISFFILLVTIKTTPSDSDDGFVKITSLNEEGRPASYEKIPYQLIMKVAGVSKGAEPANNDKNSDTVSEAEKSATEAPVTAKQSDSETGISPAAESATNTAVQGVPVATVKKDPTVTAGPKPGYTDGINNDLPEVSLPAAVSGGIETVKTALDNRKAVSVEEIMRSMQAENHGVASKTLLAEQPEISETEPAFEGKSVEVKYSPQTAITVYVYSSLSTKIFLLPSEGSDVRAWLSDDKGWKVSLLPDDIIRVQRSDTRRTQATDLFLLVGKKTYSLILQAVNNPVARTDTLRFVTDSNQENALTAESVKPEAVKSESVKPEAVKSESVKPESVKPEAVKSESVKP